MSAFKPTCAASPLRMGETFKTGRALLFTLSAQNPSIFQIQLLNPVWVRSPPEVRCSPPGKSHTLRMSATGG